MIIFFAWFPLVFSSRYTFWKHVILLHLFFEHPMNGILWYVLLANFTQCIFVWSVHVDLFSFNWSLFVAVTVFHWALISQFILRIVSIFIVSLWGHYRQYFQEHLCTCLRVHCAKLVQATWLGEESRVTESLHLQLYLVMPYFSKVVVPTYILTSRVSPDTAHRDVFRCCLDGAQVQWVLCNSLI